MGKHKQRTYDEKVNIVKEFKNGASIPYLCKKHGINGKGTISVWNKKYDAGTLSTDNRGKNITQEIEDIEILKKSYALLMEIRSKQHK